LENQYDLKNLLNEGMARCQSVTYVGDELVGDPLEIKMLIDTQWELNESNADGILINGNKVLAYVHPNHANE